MRQRLPAEFVIHTTNLETVLLSFIPVESHVRFHSHLSGQESIIPHLCGEAGSTGANTPGNHWLCNAALLLGLMQRTDRTCHRHITLQIPGQVLPQWGHTRPGHQLRPTTAASLPPGRPDLRLGLVIYAWFCDVSWCFVDHTWSYTAHCWSLLIHVDTILQRVEIHTNRLRSGSIWQSPGIRGSGPRSGCQDSGHHLGWKLKAPIVATKSCDIDQHLSESIRIYEAGANCHTRHHRSCGQRCCSTHWTWIVWQSSAELSSWTMLNHAEPRTFLRAWRRRRQTRGSEGHTSPCRPTCGKHVVTCDYLFNFQLKNIKKYLEILRRSENNWEVPTFHPRCQFASSQVCCPQLWLGQWCLAGLFFVVVRSVPIRLRHAILHHNYRSPVF